MISLSRFSSLEKLLRVTALVLKFIGLLKNQRDFNPYITTEELQKVKTLWILCLQRVSYEPELQHVHSNRTRNLQLE